MIRSVIRVLVALLLVVCGLLGGRELERRDAARSVTAGVTPSGHAAHGELDWSAMPARDLSIAGVFLAARSRGLEAALDSFGLLVARDSSVRALGDGGLHHVVHTLGRFAVLQNGNDPAVFAVCRPDFRSGCYHGVLEGYFASGASLDSAALAALCSGIVPDTAPPRLGLECAHGMGHGLAARSVHDATRALPFCDMLRDAAMEESCRDGVFMEAVNFASSGLAAPAGTAATQTTLATSHNEAQNASMDMSHGMSHGMSHDTPHAASRDANGAMSQATPNVAALRPTRDAIRVLCDGRPERALAACWYYESIALLEDAHGDAPKALARCAEAPMTARRACASGVGKQAMGEGLEARMAAACRTADSALASGCRAGVVQYYVDERWTLDGATAFCRSLSVGVAASTTTSERADCFQSLGAALAPLRRTLPAREAACMAAAMSSDDARACRVGVMRPLAGHA